MAKIQENSFWQKAKKMGEKYGKSPHTYFRRKQRYGEDDPRVWEEPKNRFSNEKLAEIKKIMDAIGCTRPTAIKRLELPPEKRCDPNYKTNKIFPIYQEIMERAGVCYQVAIIRALQGEENMFRPKGARIKKNKN